MFADVLDNKSREVVNRCIVLNETAQGLIKEAVSSIESEIAQLRKEVEPVTIDGDPDTSYVHPKSNVVYRPFFRGEGNDVCFF